MITAITCTGDRPRPFSLCIEYMARQSRKPDQWVIVDDGRAPLSYESQSLEQLCGIGEVQILRRLPQPDDPAHTLSVNLLVALDRVGSDKVVFVEDDDWYGREHVAIVDSELESCEMFGFRGIVQYHVEKRCHRTIGENALHSSLCQTGIRAGAFPILKRVCSRVHETFVDMRLWRGFMGGKKLSKYLGTVVGIKGLPGRIGLTSGWSNADRRFMPDPSLKFLESLIGRDAENYRECGSHGSILGREQAGEGRVGLA